MQKLIYELKTFLLQSDIANTSPAFKGSCEGLVFESFLPSFYSFQHGIEHNIVISKGDTKLIQVFIRVMELDCTISVHANFQRYISSNIGYFLDDFEEWESIEKESITSYRIIKILNNMLVEIEEQLKDHFRNIHDDFKETKALKEQKFSKKCDYLKMKGLTVVKYPLGETLYESLIFDGHLTLCRYNNTTEEVQTELLRFNDAEHQFLWVVGDVETVISKAKAKRLVYSSYYEKSK